MASTTTPRKPKKTAAPKKAPAREKKKEVQPPSTDFLETSPDGAPASSVSKETKAKKPERYYEAVGRRKTAIARVRMFTRAGDFTVNDRPYAPYFPTLELQKIVEEAMKKMKLFGRFRISVKTQGGGIHAQAEALRHGLARVLVKFNPDFRKRLKRAGFLTRDPRMKERKKFGLKRARRAPQWQKR
jgi:small subunit ribosomal protein S9